MPVILAILAGVLLGGSGVFLEGECPSGTHRWTDKWGNTICRDFDTGETKAIEGSTESCPTGTLRWLDEWGNTVCESFDREERYYDTTEGCPVGFHRSVDGWGNEVCRPFAE